MSNIKKPSSKIRKRFQRVDWLSSCGSSIQIELPFDLKTVDTPEACRQYYSSENWEAVTLEARNRQTQYLHDHHRSDYSRYWNDTVVWANEFCEEHVFGELRQVKEAYGFDEKFMHCVQWDILGVLMEDAFKDYNIPVFFEHLFKVYEAGHFPCGWEGAWPEEHGKLVVF